MKSTPRAPAPAQRGVRDLEHHELHAIDAEMAVAWQASTSQKEMRMDFINEFLPAFIPVIDDDAEPGQPCWRAATSASSE